MDFTQLTEELNKVDEELAGLFRKRMELSGKALQCTGPDRSPVLDRMRERETIIKAESLVGDELGGYARVLYTTLFDLSHSYQTSLSAGESELTRKILRAAEQTDKLFPEKGVVACQGVEGAYSQLACVKLFRSPSIMYFRSFEGVFQAVSNGMCQYGVLPIENSSYGSVDDVYDLMRDYNFHIVRSIKLRVDHNLLAKPGVKMSDIKEIISHGQAIGQCSKYLGGLNGVKVTRSENTAQAAKFVAESSRTDIAAISSRNCAELYGLSVLSDHVQNSENNYTRFICISKDMQIYPGANRMSLMFSVSHKPGSLYNMIAKFSAMGLNLTKIESRPIPGRDFEFMFYFDLEASVWSENVMKLISELSKSDELFVFLGCYSEI